MALRIRGAIGNCCIGVLLFVDDDLDAAGLARVGEAAFLTLQTSSGNHQAWVALSDLTNGEDAKDFARRLRKGAGADLPLPAPPGSQAPSITNASINLTSLPWLS